MSDKQTPTKQTTAKAPTETELANALGKGETKPEPKVVAEAVASAPASSGVTLEAILPLLPEKSRKQIESITDKTTALDLAKDFFSLMHPEGLKAEFEKALPETIRKLADQFMVSLDGKQITAKFPNTNGSEAVAELVDPTAVKTKSKGDRDTEHWNGASVKSKDGNVMNYEGPGPMAKALGYMTKGWSFKNTTDCFTHPISKADGKTELKPAYGLDMTRMSKLADGSWDKSKGLHIVAI